MSMDLAAEFRSECAAMWREWLRSGRARQNRVRMSEQGGRAAERRPLLQPTVLCLSAGQSLLAVESVTHMRRPHSTADGVSAATSHCSYSCLSMG